MSSAQVILEIRDIRDGTYLFDLKIPYENTPKSFSGLVDITPYKDDIRKFWSDIINKEMSPDDMKEEIAVLKDSIFSLGGSLWNCVECDESLGKGFNALEKYVTERKGIVDFVLKYDTKGKYDVPWELMLTPKRELSWCETCMTCRVPKNSLPSINIKKERNEIVNVLILIASSKGLKKFLEKEQEFYKLCSEKFLEINKICEHVEREKKGRVSIDYIKSERCRGGELRVYIQNLKKQYDLLVIVGESIIKKDEEKSKFGALNVPLRGERDGSIIKNDLIPLEGTPVYFLDTCCSARNYEEGYTDFKAGTHRSIEKMLNVNGEEKSKAVIFIGQLLQVEILTALIYVQKFLKVLFCEDSSIAGAVWEAREKTREELENMSINEKDKKLLKDLGEYQTKTYTVYGINENVLCSAPAFWKRKNLEIFWLPVSGEYYKSISERLVQPISVRDYKIEYRKMDFEAIKNEIESYDGPVMADFSILNFAEMRSEKERYVIIGCGFVPREDDCGVFINRESIKDLFKEKYTVQLYHAGEKLSVTSFLSILLETGEELPKDAIFSIHPHLTDYEMIAKDIKTYMTREEKAVLKAPPTAWLLAGKYFFLMREAVKKLSSSVKYIPIRNESCKLISDRYAPLEYTLPGTIIVARLRDVKDDPKLFYDILAEWKKVNDEVITSDQAFDIPNLFENKMKTPDVKILDVHDIKKMIFLSQETVKSIKYFTKFLKEEEIRTVGGEKLIDKEIDIDDFFPIVDLPEEWKGKDITEIKEVMLREADKLVKLGVLIYAHIGEKILEMSPKLLYRKREIKVAETRYELNAIKFKLDYEQYEITKLISSQGIKSDIVKLEGKNNILKNPVVWVDILGFKKIPQKMANKIIKKEKLNEIEQFILGEMESKNKALPSEIDELETMIRAEMVDIVNEKIDEVKEEIKDRYGISITHSYYRAKKETGGNDQWNILFEHICDALIFFYEFIESLKIPLEIICGLVDFEGKIPKTEKTFANNGKVMDFIGDNANDSYRDECKEKGEIIKKTYILVSDDMQCVLGNKLADSMLHESKKQGRMYYLLNQENLDDIASCLRVEEEVESA